jgi:hypothetical protein
VALQNETSQVLTLANAVSASGAQPKQFATIQGRIQGHVFWTVQTSGTATSLTGTIQFSLDGISWMTAAFPAGGTLPTNPSAGPTIVAYTFDTAQIASVVYIRANITAISGGNVTVLALGN